MGEVSPKHSHIDPMNPSAPFCQNAANISPPPRQTRRGPGGVESEAAGCETSPWIVPIKIRWRRLIGIDQREVWGGRASLIPTNKGSPGDAPFNPNHRHRPQPLVKPGKTKNGNSPMTAPLPTLAAPERAPFPSAIRRGIFVVLNPKNSVSPIRGGIVRQSPGFHPWSNQVKPIPQPAMNQLPYILPSHGNRKYLSPKEMDLVRFPRSIRTLTP